MPFALDSQASNTELSDAINYLLANFGANVGADPNTGIITGPTGQILGYLYKYVAVKYADSQDGSLNFSNVQTNRLYYGLRNSNDPTESTNPADYVWYQVTGGFSTTKYLYYKTTGGRQVEFFVSTTSPGAGYELVGSGSIDLDIISAPTINAQTFIAYFQPGSIQVPRTGSSLTPSFTGINPSLYGVTGTSPSTFVTAQTDSDPAFLPNTWRIGGSSSTGNADIVYVNMTVGAPTAVSGYAQWPNPSSMSASPAYINVPVRFKDAAGTVIQAQPAQCQLVFADQGAYGIQQAIAYLYQWSPTTPTNPTATSVYTWSTGSNGSYTGGGGWSTTVPANPGTPGIYLWVASKSVTAIAGTATTLVDWTTGFSVVATNGNGLNGAKAASPTVYQWAPTIPAISGTSTYTWSTQTFTPVPVGWSTTITSAPTPGYTLWAATVQISDTVTATTTSINWSTASILAAGYSGADGASSRVMYARISGNPTPINGTVTVSGDNRPSGAQASAVWGAAFNVTWYATDPNPSSNDSLYQADGIYNGTNTLWSTPYISSLKVGTLSAITVNTGALTVQDTLTLSSLGKIQGGQTGYNTGTGFFLGYSGGAYKFSLGSTSQYFLWDGSTLELNGRIISTNDAYFSGSDTSSFPITINSISYYIDYSLLALGQTPPISGNIRSGLVGVGNANTGASVNIGVVGYSPQTSNGVGVFGQAPFRAGYFICNNNAGIALEAVANSSTADAFAIAKGRFIWNNTAGAVTYAWSEPNGDGRFFRNNGSWTNALVSAVSNSGTATVNSSSQLSLLGSTSTGIAGAYVGTSATGSTVTWEIQTTSPSDRRLKQDIEPSDLGLDFVKQLQPKKYRLKADPRQQIGYGFIADEVAALGVKETSLVYHEPGWKVGDEQGFDTIHYPSYVAVLVKAVQELSAKVDTLQAEVDLLKQAK